MEEQNKNFKIRYQQNVKAALSNKQVAKTVKEIRRALKIPDKGFYSNKLQQKFNKWILQQAEDNFSNIQKVLEIYKKIINTKPYWLLDWIKFNIENYGAYIIEEHSVSNIIFCPSVEIFDNYINEKPVSCIFDYILFGKIISPQTNFISITQANSFSSNNFGNSYLNILVSPNTTKRDFESLWPEINRIQKNLKGFKKGKTRIKKNFDDDLFRIFHYDNRTQQLIKKNKSILIKKLDIHSRRLYDSIDNLFYDDPDKFNGKEDELYRHKRRKRKERIKKLIELS